MESIDVGCAQLLSSSNSKLDFGSRPCGHISSYITDTGARDEMDDCSKYVLGKDSCKYQQRSRQLQSSFCLYKFVLEKDATRAKVRNCDLDTPRFKRGKREKCGG